MPVSVATSCPARGTCQVPAGCPPGPGKRQKITSRGRGSPWGQAGRQGLRSCSSSLSQCPDGPNVAHSTQHSQLPGQGGLPWYFACWCNATGKKALELVSLRVDDWRRGLKTGEDLYSLFWFQLEFESAAGWPLQGEILVPLCPQGSLSLKMPSSGTHLKGFLRAWVNICAMALLSPMTWWVFHVACKLSPPLRPDLHSSVYHSLPEPGNHFCGWASAPLY